MASLDEVWKILKEDGGQDARLAETLRQALAEEERRKADLLADALARRLRPAEPEPAPVEPEPPPARRAAAGVSDKTILSRLKAGESIKVIHRETGASMPRIRSIKKKHGIPNAVPGPKPRVVE